MNSKKQRRSLDDSLAADFVFGAQAPQSDRPTVAESPIEELPVDHPQPVRSAIMEKLMTAPEKERVIRFTVDLPESMHTKLSLLCARTGRKKADVVRMLLNEALAEVEG